MIRFWVVTISMFISTSAICQVEESPWYIGAVEKILKNFPEVNAWFFAMMIFIAGLLRVSAELMLFVSQKTENLSDDKWAKNLSTWAEYAAKFVGWFGLGKPKGIKPKG